MTNKQRAARALRALIYYGSQNGEVDVFTNMVDLLTDMRHLAKQRKRDECFNDCVATSYTHFIEEVAEAAHG